MDDWVARKPLKGALEDALHAVMCGAGHKIRMLIKKLGLLFTRIWTLIVERLTELMREPIPYAA